MNIHSVGYHPVYNFLNMLISLSMKKNERQMNKIMKTKWIFKFKIILKADVNRPAVKTIASNANLLFRYEAGF